MTNPDTHEQRSQALADEIRRFLTAVNTGGIATTVAFAASLAGNEIQPRWAVIPISIFLLGIVFAALSTFLAQHREIARRDAAQKNKSPPRFNFLLWSWLWNWLGLSAFICASIISLGSLASFSV